MTHPLADFPWYHGRIDRGTTESILRGRRPGLFLVRDSTSCPGDFVLSVSESGKVSHYIINRRGGIYIIGDQTFDTLPGVIDFYRRHFLDTTTLIEIATRQGPVSGVAVPVVGIAGPTATSNPLSNPIDHPSSQPSVMFSQPGMMPSQAYTRSPMHPMGQPPMQQPQVHAPFMQPVAPSMGGQMPLQPPQQAGPVLQEQALEMVEGLYKFESGDAEDLPFQKGDIMYILRKEEDGWWFARHSDGREGLIPVPYIKLVEKVPTRTESVMHHHGRPHSQHSRSPPFSGITSPPVRAKAIMDRVANAYDNTALSFKLGDVILVTKQNENGLWEGELNGRSGHFPFTHVEVIEADRGGEHS
ncbi:crk-like protein isoform X2 [Corticium candelabrum]|uniref:crk-like protein isoform X2 n=1 Tax=Corticium candelabrum TaxID=121492 RepID=UPI002E2607E2|nr:crk-like protein isoform X2 [Corticium candelabrum]